MIFGVCALFSLGLGVSAHAQVNQSVPVVVPEQEVPIAVVEGHTIVTGSKVINNASGAEALMRSVEDDLKSQQVDPLHPKTGKYYLRLGTDVVRVIVYINAQKSRIRWEPVFEIFKFDPENLPELILSSMMESGRLKKMTYPTDSEFASALQSELTKDGVNLKTPQSKKVCVKLGYSRCKMVLDFTDKALVQWSFKGQHFLPGNYPEGMLRVLQSQGYFKNASGKDLVILHGDDVSADPLHDSNGSGNDAEKKDASSKKNVSSALLDEPLPRVSTATETVTRSKVSTAAPQISVTQAQLSVVTPQANQESNQITLKYDLSDDYSDYNDFSDQDSGISVSGLSNGMGQNGGSGDGNGNGNGSGSGFGNGNGGGGFSKGLGFIPTQSIKTSITNGVSPCNSVVRSGGYGTTTVPMNFGSTAGRVNISFETYQIPDQMLIRCNNHTMDVQFTPDGSFSQQVHGTPFFSGLATISFDYKPFGVGDRANVCQIVVNGNEDHGTIWQFDASCPMGAR